MKLTTETRKNTYPIETLTIQKIQEETVASMLLSIGTYSISIKKEVLGEDIQGEPVVLLWIHGGLFINKKTNAKVSATCLSLNGYEDRLTLEVLEPTNLRASFFGANPHDNEVGLTLNINKIGVVGNGSVVLRNIAKPAEQPVKLVLSLANTQKADDGEIYQRIWENDENKFSVSPRNAQGGWDDENADILLDEQVQADGKREIDLATRPLFHRVNESKLFDENGTYVSFIKLLDNYAINSVDPELTTEEEVAEQQKFLSLIVQTKPMQIAREYINQTFGENLSEQQFQQKLYRIWFESYTNYYKAKSTDYCSGFEHVFVGEGKYDSYAGDNQETLGKISGYHSWVKFYLDEKNQRVNYLGYKYDLKGDDGPKNPNVVTLQQIQNVMNMRGEVIAQLFKSKGGFFVGPSAECEIAIGTVAYYESLHGKMQDQRRIKINGANYDLVLYRNINPNGTRGEFIRSFFPIFLGLDKSNGTDKPQINEVAIKSAILKPIEVNLKNDGVVVIASALPNPRGVDESEEWVELRNNTDQTIDLTGWQLLDKLEHSQSLQGAIAPNEVKRVNIHCTHPRSMELINKSGLITLRDEKSHLIALVKYDYASSGEVLSFE
jgi:poly(U)-specific endoribonuclease